MTTDLFNSGVRPAIDDWLLEKAKEKRDYGLYWSASSAGYCQRRLIFERLGVPHVQKDDNARKQRIFTSGHLFHAWIQDITKKAGISIAQEVELQDEDLMIRGHFDDLVLVNDGEPFSVGDGELDGQSGMTDQRKKLILYDYKTVNSQSFKYKNDLSYYHKMQLGTYMYMLRNYKGLITRSDVTITNIDLTEARILLISKDDLRMKEQQLMWSTELESEVLEFWKSLNTHWKNKTLPRCTCADHENGFLAKEKWNPYYKNGEPCSIEVYKEFRAKEAANAG